MNDISVVKTAEDPASKALQVTVPVARVREAENRAVKQYSRRVRLPGFRKGKAPEVMVRKRFSDEIRQMVIQEVIREGWDAAREAEDLKPLRDPAVRNLKFEDGAPVEFELLVEVKPEITLQRFGGFKLTRTLVAVSDDQVAEQIEQLRSRRASWMPVEGQRPELGHRVSGEVASIEGETVHAGKPFVMVLGEGEAIPDLEDQIMRLTPGEVAEADVRFPDDHPDETRRGQTRRVRVTLHEVKRKELPEVDDAFAAAIGDFPTVADLKTAIREDLEREAERTADSKVREDLIMQLAEANNLVSPPSLVERVLHGFAHAYEVPAEQFENFATQFRPIAIQQVRRDLVLSAVAEAHGLRATEGDLDARIAEIAESRNSTPAEVYRSLEEAKRLPELERALTEEKVFDFLLNESTVSEEQS